MFRFLLPSVLLLTTGLAPAFAQVPADHAERMQKGAVLFTKHVRQLLIDSCLKCHGGDKTRGDLDLSSRESLLSGTKPVVVPFHAKDSRLYKLVNHLEMPHMPSKGDKLKEADLVRLTEWIDLGAPYDKPLIEKVVKTKKPMEVTEADRKFWSFQPLTNPKTPAVKDSAWTRNPIDGFILAKLEEKQLKPNAAIDRRRFIRRVYFDLIGLPPTPEEVEAYLKDATPQAEERLIDKLLKSPHHGERWGRHWLDLARFAESSGYEHDYDRPHAYHYRDFVIKAFNQDLPFSTFVKWQIAGDEYEPGNPQAMMATGFLAAGVHSTQITKNLVEKERYEQLDDKLKTLGTAMLGLTVGCARCHDHKYDPIPTRDYYRMLSTFTTTVKSNIDLVLDPTLPKAPKTKVLVASEGVPPLRMHTQGGDFFPETYFLKRGDTDQKDGIATPSFLQVLMRHPDQEKHWQAAPPKGVKTSYRRRALAEWITDTDTGAGNLLARVIVNRLWQHHLGRGLVRTASDFGYQGEPPTHPELLDWLAQELVKNNWSLHHIHRLILTSATYRQSSDLDPEKVKVDSDNKLVWHRPRLRLEAEILRDNLLAVSGQLDVKQFGPGTLDPNMKRRSIYFTVKRSKLVPALALFDAPDALQGIDRRPQTTIAPQALLLMNNDQVRRLAESFAKRVAQSTSEPFGDVVRRGYQTALGRLPTTQEEKETVAFLEEQAQSYRQEGRMNARDLALADFCQVLLGLNEFVYVD